MLHRLSFLAFALFSSVGLAANAQPEAAPQPAPTAQAGAANAPDKTPWQTLSQLGGSWRLAAPSSAAEKAFRIDIRPISKASALVEIFGTRGSITTETVYHRDGQNIMATHYCAQGNQPRLLLTPVSQPGALSFKFHDITNLNNKADSHLIRIDFKIIDDNQLERRETYTQNGIVEESTLRLKREW